MVTEATHGSWQRTDFHSYLEIALEAFGAERLMIGRDWPVCLLAAEYADTMGIVTDTLTASGFAADEAVVRQLTDGRMAEVVVDATGSPESMGPSLGFCSFGGRLVDVEITQQTISLPHAPVLHRRELSLLASRNAMSRDFTRIVGLIESKAIDTKPWITHRLPFADTIQIFPSLLASTSGVVKAVIEMPWVDRSLNST